MRQAVDPAFEKMDAEKFDLRCAGAVHREQRNGDLQIQAIWRHIPKSHAIQADIDAISQVTPHRS